jgi:hypothetical protein
VRPCDLSEGISPVAIWNSPSPQSNSPIRRSNIYIEISLTLDRGFTSIIIKTHFYLSSTSTSFDLSGFPVGSERETRAARVSKPTMKPTPRPGISPRESHAVLA